MKHKWEKTLVNVHITGAIDVIDNDGNIHKCFNIHECINCGLRKGNKSSGGLFITIIYFKDDKFLSFNRIPYECSGINFLKEDDFYIT